MPRKARAAVALALRARELPNLARDAVGSSLRGHVSACLAVTAAFALGPQACLAGTPVATGFALPCRAVGAQSYLLDGRAVCRLAALVRVHGKFRRKAARGQFGGNACEPLGSGRANDSAATGVALAVNGEEEKKEKKEKKKKREKRRGKERIG